MCDTVCSLNENNKDQKITLFGKNSDRDPNEIQTVEFYPRSSRKGKIHTTYIDVEYDGVTNAVILSRPKWMWGAEMGVNEKGVAAGNEAIFSNPKNKEKSLLGMDLLRLGLERGNDAMSVVNTIIEYLQTYGQGGSNDQFKEEYYNNLYLIADSKHSFELAIIGKEYLVMKGGLHDSVSNKIPFRRDDKEVKISPGFSAREDLLYTKLGRGKERSEFTDHELANISGTTKLQDIFQLMKHHNSNWSHPREGSNKDICMHAGPLSRRFQTVNSMVVEIAEKGSIVWSTFSSNPCISLYKPVLFSENMASGLSYGSDYWLKSEKLHRDYYLNSGSISMPDSSTKREMAQSKIIDLTVEMRNKLISGMDNDSVQAEKIFQEIQNIDESYLSSLQSESNHSYKLISFYGNWWRKKGKLLN